MINLFEAMCENGIGLSNGYAISDGDAEKTFREADEMLYADKASKKVEKLISQYIKKD